MKNIKTFIMMSIIILGIVMLFQKKEEIDYSLSIGVSDDLSGIVLQNMIDHGDQDFMSKIKPFFIKDC